MARVPRLRIGKPAEAGEAPAGDLVPVSDSGRDNETERERQLHGLAVLSLFLQSSGSIDEMVSRLLEQAPTVTGAVFVYPLLLDRKRQLIRASILEGTTDPKLEAAMEAFQEDLTALEFSLVRNQDLYRILEEGEVAVRDGFGVLMDGVLPEEQWEAAAETLP